MNLAQNVEALFRILGDGFPTQRLGLILQNKELILQWLHSQEFQEQYKNHSFPPLFNPKQIQYDITDPQIAWDFNLPLPKFDMLVSIAAGAGGSAFYKFLTLCDVDCYSKWHGHFLAYLENYKLFSKSQNFKALIVTDFISDATLKFWSLIPRMPMLHLVRDPLLILKPLINHTRPIQQKPLAMRFNLTCDVKEILPEVAYHCSDEKPNLENVINDCINGLYRGLFCFAEKLEVIKPTEVLYLDVKEISGENAFKTFCSLSIKFGFQPPKKKYQQIFSQRINKNSSLTSAFPVTLYAHRSDIGKKYQDLTTLAESVGGGVNLKILTRFDAQKDAVDLTEELLKELPKESGEILITTTEQEAEILRGDVELKEAVRKFLSRYFEEFQKKNKAIQKNLIPIDAVLEYFKTHKFQRDAIAGILERELAHIKKHRLDIVDGWEYYLEFQKMCKNL